MKSRFLLLVFFLSLYCTNSYSQDWEGDLSLVGNVKQGGFDYHLSKYTESEVGSKKKLPLNYTGTRTISHAPAPGVHPRIYFNEEDKEDILFRLQNTRTGKELVKRMRAHTVILNLGYGGNGYNKNKPYSTNPQGITYIDNPGMYNPQFPATADPAVANKRVYDVISAEGTPKGYLAANYLEAGKPVDNLRRFMSSMSMEAYECYLMKNEDGNNHDLEAPYTAANSKTYKERAEALARAMSYWAQDFVDAFENRFTPAKIAESYWNNAGGMYMPTMYDLNYWAMTEEQRGIVRKCISMMVPAYPKYGLNCEPFTTTSNWTTLNFFEIIPNLAIEGEEGYNPELTKKWVNVLYKFVNYGFYEDGFPWEGLGKNYLMMGQLVALSKRGYSFLGHPQVRAYCTNFLPQITQPFGHAFLGDDLYGGSDGGNGKDPVHGNYRFNIIDAVGLNYAYPEDEKCGYVWRNYICNRTAKGAEYVDCTSAFVDPGSHYYHDYFAILLAYADDWAGDEDFNTHQRSVIGEQTDYASDGRGLVIMRSEAEKNGLYLQFNVRQNFGGHTSADRNDISFSGLGRIWIPREAAKDIYTADFFSIPLIDGKTIPVTNKEGGKSRQPARLVSYDEFNDYTVATGDATYAYNWEYYWDKGPLTADNPYLSNGQGWEKALETLNDFLMEKRTDEPYFDKPFYEFGYWDARVVTDKERIVKKRYNTLQNATRTVALSKGKYPFVLIADNIRKEEGSADYCSYLQMAKDLSLDKIEKAPENSGHLYDIIMKEPVSSGKRRLLIRVFGHNNYLSDGIIQADFGQLKDAITGEQISNSAGQKVDRNRIRLEAKNVISPDFELMLYPFYEGDELPETKKTEDGYLLKWKDTERKINFDNEGEITRISVGEEITTGISSVKTDNKHIQISFIDRNQIKVSADEDILVIELYDLNGQTFYSKSSIKTREHLLTVTNMPQMFVLKCRTENHNESFKILL